MTNKLKILKYYPAVILFFLSILSLSFFTDGSEFGNVYETIMKIFGIFLFISVPIFCIVMNLMTLKYVKYCNLTSYEYVKTSFEIKNYYKDIYIVFIILGIICTITVFPIMVTVLIIFVVWSMQFQTACLSKIGVKDMLNTGIIDKNTYVKYLYSRYIIFKDIAMLKKLLEIIQKN